MFSADSIRPSVQNIRFATFVLATANVTLEDFDAALKNAANILHLYMCIMRNTVGVDPAYCVCGGRMVIDADPAWAS